MRIAYVNADPGVPVFGTKGASLHVREVMEGFMRAGADVDLFALRLDGPIPASWNQVRLHQLPALPQADPSQREQAARRSNHDVRQALEHSGGLFELIYERYSLWSFGAMEYARDNRISSVLEVNAPLIEEQKAYRTLGDEASARAAMRRAFAAAGHITVVSEEMARYVTRNGSDPEKVRLLPNAVNPGRFPAEVVPACPGPPGSFTIGFLGSMRPWHGLPLLVEAFDLFQRSSGQGRLLVVGEGPERSAIAEMVKARGLDAMTVLAGAVPAERVPAYLASMDLAVAPYPNLEPFYFSPLKVYESMAAARAVVASRIGQLKTLIEHGVNGWHVPPGDVGALAEAMLHLWRDSALRRRLGQEARRSVLRHHTWDQVVHCIGELASAQSRRLNYPPHARPLSQSNS